VLNINFSQGTVDMPKISAIEVIPVVALNQPPVANAGGNKLVILPTNSVTLTGSGSDPEDGTNVNFAWSKLSGGVATIVSASSATTQITGLTEGSYSFRLTVTDSKGLTSTSDAIVTVTSNSSLTTLRINSGGEQFTATGSRVFSADAYFTGTRTKTLASGDILNTTDDVLYRSERSEASFAYNIPVVNGSYNVVLHFAEIYWGAPGGGSGGSGKRRFNVDIESSRKLTNFDIFVAAGGAMRPVLQTFPVSVTDGVLNINFSQGTVDMPKISAIEVLPASSAVTASNGRQASPEVNAAGSLLGNASVTIYPNPNAGEKIFIDLKGFGEEEEVEINLINETGKVVKTTKVYTSAEGSVETVLSFRERLAPGMYVIRGHSQTGRVYRKVVVQ
jgi:hypothetical protein